MVVRDPQHWSWCGGVVRVRRGWSPYGVGESCAVGKERAVGEMGEGAEAHGLALALDREGVQHAEARLAHELVHHQPLVRALVDGRQLRVERGVELLQDVALARQALLRLRQDLHAHVDVRQRLEDAHLLRHLAGLRDDVRQLPPKVVGDDTVVLVRELNKRRPAVAHTHTPHTPHTGE